ncbi:hypothetical protein QZH41_001517 [Actinostola sp. cb2023]|nr:hypothetical protein QZH41_001517 [Actinostola sp. cb2023]
MNPVNQCTNEWLKFLPTLTVVDKGSDLRSFGRFSKFGLIQAAQQPNESMDAYVTRLRNLAKTCEYKEAEDEMIRDQTVDKCASNTRARLNQRQYRVLDKSTELWKGIRRNNRQETPRGEILVHKGMEGMLTRPVTRGVFVTVAVFPDIALRILHAQHVMVTDYSVIYLKSNA